MGVFSSVSNQVGNKVKGFFDKRREEREEEEVLEKEQRQLEKTEYKKAFRESAKKAARIKAQRDAGKKTGLTKLRAIGRAKDLENPNKRSLLPKLSEHMNRNIAKRQENLEKTKLLREEAQKIKEQKINKMPNQPKNNELTLGGSPRLIPRNPGGPIK